MIDCSFYTSYTAVLVTASISIPACGHIMCLWQWGEAQSWEDEG